MTDVTGTVRRARRRGSVDPTPDGVAAALLAPPADPRRSTTRRAAIRRATRRALGERAARSVRPATLAIWLVGLLLGGAKLVSVLVTPWPFSQLALDSDDSRYYVLTALHAAQGGGSTFDGLQVTNGYQPLWFLVLTAAYRVTGVDRAGAVVVTVVLLIALWALALWLLARLGRAVLGPVGTVVGLVALVPHARWWSGCENALVGVVLLAVVTTLLGRGLLTRAPATRDVALLGGLLAVLALTRLDTVVLVGLLAVVGAATWHRRVVLLPVLVGPVVVTLAAYAALNQWLVGTALPVSGLAKQLGPLGQNLGIVGDFLLFGRLGPLPMCFGATLLVVGVAALLVLRPSRRGVLPEPLRHRAAEVRTVIAVLLVGQVLQVGYYAVASTWDLQGWYFSFGVVGLVLAAGVLGARFSTSRVVRYAAPALLVVLVAVFALHDAAAVTPRDPVASGMVRDVDGGQWADRTLPPGAVIAMGDMAATFADSTAHPVVQLEGLVSAPGYLDALRAGTVPAYLHALGVRYYARMMHDGETVGCAVREPYYGRGPGTTIRVCGHAVLYRGPTAGGELVVWDLAFNGRGVP